MEEQLFQPLPGRPVAGRQMYRRVLGDLLGLLGLAPTPDFPEVEDGDLKQPILHLAFDRYRAWTGPLPEAAFDLLVEAAVREPNPSTNRYFVEPALNAFGRRRVHLALLARLRHGENWARAGAARARYWASVSRVGYPHLMPGVADRSTVDAVGDLVPVWCAELLREFVANEDLDVRRCVLPDLPLNPESHPPQDHDLVTRAVAIARAHPDDYLRHRVEIQVKWGLTDS